MAFGIAGETGQRGEDAAGGLHVAPGGRWIATGDGVTAARVLVAGWCRSDGLDHMRDGGHAREGAHAG